MDKNSCKSDILILNALAGDRGHLINDDLFLAECLEPFANVIEVRSSPTSVANISNHLSARALSIKKFGFLSRFPRLQLIVRLLAVPRLRYQDIFFPAFEEVSTLLFMLLHPGKNVHLIYHNNLSRERRGRHPYLWALFTKMVALRATSLFVPSRFQSDCLKAVCPEIDSSKIFIRPFDQIAKPQSPLAWSERLQTMFFMGPLSIHKPIEPLINLIQRDTKRRYRYLLRRIDNIDSDTRSFLEAQPNVDLASGYIDTDEYHQLFREASWVITTHNLLFEGKLSGIFCDAIAAGTPIITSNMAPHDEFFERFGDMGILVDYDDSQWCERFLNTDFSSKQEGFQLNMAACRQSCTMEAIRMVYHAALNRTRFN